MNNLKLLGLILFSFPVFAGGEVTITEDQAWPVQSIVFDWVADATGDVDAATTTNWYSGSLERASFINDNATASRYDIEILDSNGVDLLAGAGYYINEATTAISTFTPASATDVNSLVNGQLTLSVENAGALKEGRVLLYIKR